MRWGATSLKRSGIGHTLLLDTTGFLVQLPFQKRNLPYDPWRDFTPITSLMAADLVLEAHPGSAQ